MDVFTNQFRNYTGYSERERPAEDSELTHVGPNTPCGEYLRQYWHGIALSNELGEVQFRCNSDPNPAHVHPCKH